MVIGDPAKNVFCLSFQLQKDLFTTEQMQSVKEQLGVQCNELLSVQMEAKKPNFDVGSSSQLRLSFVKKPASLGKRAISGDLSFSQHMCGQMQSLLNQSFSKQDPA